MGNTYDYIAVRYDLPKNWSEERNFSFEHLSQLVEQVHNSAYSSLVKAINRFATIRNYIIEYYIVEYEQNGSDRAKYGDKLLKRLAEQVNKRGINETLLKVSCAFYLNYTLLLERKGTASPDIHKSVFPSRSKQETGIVITKNRDKRHSGIDY